MATLISQAVTLCDEQPLFMLVVHGREVGMELPESLPSMITILERGTM